MNDVIEVDVAIIGAGSTGETVALRCAAGGLRVAMIESSLVGGACPYLACIPAKSLLYSAAAGESWDAAIALRERHVQFRSDRAAGDRLRAAGVILVRGHGQLVAENIVRVRQNRSEVLVKCTDLVIATGSEPIMPSIPGLEQRFIWSSDQALSSAILPLRVAILGGGPVGCELAQIYARFGASVTLIEESIRLLPAEAPFISAHMHKILETEGVELRAPAQVAAARSSDWEVELELTRGENVTADRVIMAVGRRPQVAQLDLSMIGLDLDLAAAGLKTDAFGVIQPGVWAAGDVTGSTPFTHAANYQARAIAKNILGQDYRMRLAAVPRAVYTEPAMMAVGEVWAADCGMIRAGFDLGDTARGFLAGPISGRVELYADLTSGVIVGAAGMGPDVDHVLGQAIIAVHLGISIRAWADVIQPFPTYSEVFEEILRDLDRQRAEYFRGPSVAEISGISTAKAV